MYGANCMQKQSPYYLILQKKAETPPENKSADAQITSTLMNSQQVPPYALERHTPRAAYPPGHDPTPALRTLSEYARPHALGLCITVLKHCF